MKVENIIVNRTKVGLKQIIMKIIVLKGKNKEKKKQLKKTIRKATSK